MKNPLASAGIETATLRFVAQHLNHCATAVPTQIWERDYTNVNAIIAKRDYLLRRVCLPARNNSASTGRMFIKFDI